MKILLFLFFICSLFIFARCGIIEFEEKDLLYDETIRLKVALITEEDSIIGGKTPYFAVDQILQAPDPSIENSFIEVLAYHYTKSDKIGIRDDEGQPIYCCSDDLVEQNVCSEKGTVILEDESIAKWKVQFPEGKLSFKLTPLESGVYYIKYFNCPDGRAGDVKIDGTITWMNPFGQLSAELYPLLWFFGFLTICYLVLGVIWLIFSALHWQELLMLQNCIAGVIFLGMVECITWYFDFLSYNSNGHFNWGAIIIGILSSTLKRTVSRVLVLIVALGYGVVKANLGSDTNRVALLGVTYFCVSGTQQLILTSLREGDNEFLSLVASLIIFPAALLDTIFYWWIFLSLSRTIQQLALRKQEVKLTMYKRFFVVLGISGILTAVIIIYESLMVVSGSEDSMWDTWWEFQAFWHILYYVILLAIAYLWRPTTNNTRYAYVESDDIFDNSKNTKLNSDINLGEELNLSFDFGLDNATANAELSKMN